jgi:asparagine synthase (glutamine-hydrolysing)
MSRLARERAVVALSGEGADELFGGYARQRYDVAMDRFGAVGRRLAPGLLRLVGRRPSARLEARFTMAPGLPRQLDWGRVLGAEAIDRLTPGLSSEDEMLAPYADLAERWRRFAATDPVNGRLEADREVFLPGDLLPKVDRMSMAHSLEVRVPFLGDEVVDLVLPMPGRLKQTLRRDKVVLRRAARELLPPETVGRRKQGFDVPIGAWLRGPLREAAGDLLSAEGVARCGLCSPGEIVALRDAHLAGRLDLGREVWALLVLHHWLGAAS